MRNQAEVTAHVVKILRSTILLRLRCSPARRPPLVGLNTRSILKNNHVAGTGGDNSGMLLVCADDAERRWRKYCFVIWREFGRQNIVYLGFAGKSIFASETPRLFDCKVPQRCFKPVNEWVNSFW